jgi:uncharacterized protein (TIGR02145 family)
VAGEKSQQKEVLMNKTKLISLTASLVLAITFTISCEDKEAKDKPAVTAAPPTEAAKAENSDKPSAEAPSAPTPEKVTFTDPRDGKKYKSVKIGEQVWMAENLNFAAKGSKCYDNKPENCEKYGRLYNWETAMKACPSGWHLPSQDEYEVLNNTPDVGEEGKRLKAKIGWDDNDGKPGNGTDDFGFSALPGGYGSSDGSFGGVGDYGGWWNASENEYDSSSTDTYSIRNRYEDGVYWVSSYKSDLSSVRCIQD